MARVGELGDALRDRTLIVADAFRHSGAARRIEDHSGLIGWTKMNRRVMCSLERGRNIKLRQVRRRVQDWVRMAGDNRRKPRLAADLFDSINWIIKVYRYTDSAYTKTR